MWFKITEDRREDVCQESRGDIVCGGEFVKLMYKQASVRSIKNCSLCARVKWFI